ncbi:MAG TPA: PRC-barrel domain-containing protein [Microvirga sp.]|nr:PRC-barrel domain-containing protein [Microvirga sp.]
MRMTPVAAGLLCSTLLAPAALAQAPAGSAGPAGTETSGGLRVSDLIGQSVVGADNREVGEIEDVILEADGRIAAFIIEMEGGLGLDDREIAVPAGSIRIDPADSTGTIRSQGQPGGTAAGQQTGAQTAMNAILAPGRVTLTIPVDQLKDAPEFDED